jgi:hypothetical protein
MTTKMYVAYHKFNQKVVGATTMQVSGDFLGSEVVDITTGGRTKEAPQGAEYADVWADGPAYIALGSASSTPAAGSTEKPIPANNIVQIQNLQPFGSQIIGYALT